MSLGGGGVTVNDNEISSKSKFKELSINLSAGCFAALLVQLTNIFFGDYPDNSLSFIKLNYLLFLIIIPLIHVISNIIICFFILRSLNFVKFEQENPLKSLIGRWLFIVPIILLFLYIFYDILI